MKNFIHKTQALLLTAVFTAAFLAPAAYAAGLYVNDSKNQLQTGIDSAYAVNGSSETESIGSSNVYVMTESGLQTLSDNQSPDPGGSDIPHLSVDGRVTVPVSTVKVGLSSALVSANLQNGDGSGFTFGYYDSGRVFKSLGIYTAQTEVSVLKDQNMYYSSSSGNYVEGTDGSALIGCYHIRLSGSYTTYSEAKTAAGIVSTNSFVKYWNGAYYAMVGSFTTADAAQSTLNSFGLSGAAVDSGTSNTVTIVKTGTSSVIMEFDGGGTTALALSPRSSDNPKTWHKGYEYYGGFEFLRSDGNITVINYVDVEDYVKGVIPYEMSSSWPLEALKAQAVCARTYVMANIGKYSSRGYDVTNDTYCQVYHGTTGANSTTDSAVDGTSGVYLTYNGSLCSALYSSSDGGGTESSLNVFGSDYAYLKGVIDPYEADMAGSIPGYSWTVTLTPEQLSAKLGSYGLSSVTGVEPAYSDTGNVIELKLTDVNGKSATLTRDKCRTALGFNNIHYSVTWSDGSQAFVFTGKGFGHNVGLSQYGAYSMAKVHSCTYDQILNFYFTGVGLRKGAVG